MGLCKCRSCGEVASSKAWSAAKEPACPHCGHTRFSISFPAAPAAQPSQAPAMPVQADAHGRRRKVIRLENFTAHTPADTVRTSFRERMRNFTGQPGKAGQDDE